MLSGWANLFSQENRNESYFQLGGPRSFHKFTYKNTTIILIGEVHQKMKNELAKRYIEIFNQFIENNHVKLFIESKGENKNTSSDDLSFIDCMSNLSSSSNLERIHADKRHYDEGFGNFFFFLNKLADVEGKIIAIYKEKNMTPPSPIPFFNESQDFIKSISMISDLYDKSFTLENFLKLLDSQIKILDQLCDKYSKTNIHLRNYLAKCILIVNDALGLALKLEEKYRLMGHNKNDNEIGTTPLIQICIAMMQYEKTFYPAQEWLHIYNLYETYFFDATLICDLWDQIDTNKDQEVTLIVATGDSHTNNLSSILKSICVPVASISADKKGKIISPEIINDNFEHAPSKLSCTLM